MHSLINIPAETVIKWAAVRLKSLQDDRKAAWEATILDYISKSERLRYFFFRPQLTAAEAEERIRAEINRETRMVPDHYLNYDVSRVKEIMRLAGLAKKFGDGFVLLSENDLGMLHAH